MSKKFEEDLDDDLRPEYDFSTMEVVARGPQRKMPQSTLLESWVGGSRATLALVITDIVGSTALNKRLGDRNWFELHNQHTQKVNELIYQGAFDCRKIKDMGDGFLIVFRTAIDAFGFAVQLHTDTGHPEIKIRASIHVGAVRIDGNDIRGGMVSFATRIGGWAKRNWIVLSDIAKQHITEELGTESSGIRFIPRQADLKDFSQQKIWIAVTPEMRRPIVKNGNEQASASLSHPAKLKTPPPYWWRRIKEEMEKENKNSF
ncbi:MAG TPA: hypothetical protein VK363_14005 [Pyrinomonadaceae bacterium]|nr:hypothetical protein [Pyrinomonadaceae bacterium]